MIGRPIPWWFWRALGWIALVALLIWIILGVKSCTAPRWSKVRLATECYENGNWDSTLGGLQKDPGGNLVYAYGAKYQWFYFLSETDPEHDAVLKAESGVVSVADLAEDTYHVVVRMCYEDSETGEMDEDRCRCLYFRKMKIPLK